MSLFATPPIVLSDGSANHTYEFKAQLQEKSGIAGRFIEPAAPTVSDSHFDVKHIEGNTNRRLISMRIVKPDTSATPVDKPITINLTVTYAKTADPTHVAEELTQLKNMLAVSGFITSFLKGQIS